MSKKVFALKEVCIGKGSYGIPASAVAFSPLLPTYLRITDIKDNGTLDFSGLKSVDDSRAKNYILSPNDIVFARTGASTGRNYFYNSRDGEFVYAGFLIKFSIDPKKVNPLFIKYFCKTDECFQWVRAFETGGTRENINANELGNMPIPVVERKQQDLLAEVLSSLDDKIDLLTRQNKTLENLAATYFRQWFVEQASDEWERGTLGDLLSVIESGSRPKGGIDASLKMGVPSIGAENINGIGVYDFSKTKFVTQEFYERMKRGIIQSLDILIYKDGAYVGRKGMFGFGFPYETCTINEHVFILRANERASQYYLYFALNEDDLAQLNSNSAQPGLNQGAMNSLPMVIPPRGLITQFDELVSPIFEKILKNSKQAKTLATLRDTLLPKLISGEVRVKTEVAA